MRSKDSILNKSWEIFSSVLVLVVLSFILSLFYDSVLAGYLKGFSLLIFLPVKIFFYSGIYGHLIEVISGESLFITYKGIKRNTRDYWKMYSFFLVLPFILHFFFTNAFVQYSDASISIFYAHFNIIILYLMSTFIIDRKYIRPFRIPKKRIRIKSKETFLFFLLYLLEMGLFYLPQAVDGAGHDFQNFNTFLLEGLRYFQFIFLAALILNNHPKIFKTLAGDTPRELLLINPIGGGVFNSLGSLIFRRNSAAFVVLKALTPKNYKIKILNQYVIRKRWYQEHRLVAITCCTYNSYNAYKIAKEFKESGATVIMGGPHVGFLPNEALEFCHSVVVGEAESVWKEVICDYENNVLKTKYIGSPLKEFSKEVHAEILSAPLDEMKDYLQTTRGCKFKCDFCSVPSLCLGGVRKKDINEIVEIFKKLRHKYQRYYFLDNNIYSDPSYAKELFKALKPLKIKWASGCSIDIVKDREALVLAKESGCEGLLFGYEILSNSSQIAKGGKYSLVAKYTEYSKIVQEMGISIKGSFILGWEEDRWKTLFDLWIFALKIKPQVSIVNLLTPLPGSQLFDKLLKEKRLMNLNWRNYYFDYLVFKHERINGFIMSKVFVFFRAFFLVTTSKDGHLAFWIVTFVLVLPYFLKNFFG